MIFNSRRKLFLMIGVSLAVLAFWGWILAGLLQQVKNTSITLYGLEEKVADLEARRKAAGDIQILLQDRAKDLAKINNFSVSKERPVVFIEELEDVAKKTKNRVAIDFDEARSKGKNIFFRLAIDGNENSVLRYLKLLEFMPYKIKVEEASLQRLTSAQISTSLTLPKESEVPLSHHLEVLIRVETL